MTPSTAGPPLTAGVVLTFETLNGAETPLRLQPTDDTLLRIIDGLVRLTVDGAERVMGIGDEAIIPAGAAHRLAALAGRARVVSGLRPAR
jgi:quercetin dioxygenase-like cupin family protein